jgi:hypothetical protein
MPGVLKVIARRRYAGGLPMKSRLPISTPHWREVQKTLLDLFASFEANACASN